MLSWRSLLNLLAPRQRSGAPFTDSELDDEPQPEYERYIIPRQVVFLRPEQLYARWVEQCTRRSHAELRKIPEYTQLQGTGKPRMTALAEMRADCTAYLIELHDEEDLTALEQVERDYVFFFKRELELWEGTDETHWPPKLTLALFRQWFDIECFDMVLDTAKV